MRIAFLILVLIGGQALAQSSKLDQIGPRVQSPSLSSTTADRQRLSRELRDFRAAEQPFQGGSRQDQLELHRLERALSALPNAGGGAPDPVVRPGPRTRLLDKGPRQIELDPEVLD